MTFTKQSILSVPYILVFLVVVGCTTNEEKLKKGWWKYYNRSGNLNFGDGLKFDSSHTVRKDTIFSSGKPMALFAIEERELSRDAILTLHSFDRKHWVQYVRK